MKTWFSLTLLSMIFLYACKKDSSDTLEPALPESPATSQHKFSCYRNGLYIGTDSTFAVFYMDSSAYTRSVTLDGGYLPDSSSITFGFIDTTFSQLINLNTSIPFGPSQFLMSTVKNGLLIYYHGYSGSLQFSMVDTLNHRISGSFNCSLSEPTTHDTVHVTYGKFNNLSYELYPQ